MQRRQFITVMGAGAAVLAGCSEQTERQSGDGGSGAGGNGGDDGQQQKVMIEKHEFYSEQYSAGVRGIIENLTDETLSYVQINVYFFDSSDTRIGEGLDNVNDLSAGRRWEFDAMYLGQDPERIDSYEIQAEVI